MGNFKHKFLVLLIIWLAGFSLMSAHPWKAGHYVIVDTDGGLDDFRAINFMLASPEIRVLAITTSAGVLKEQESYGKLRALLSDLHQEGIITAQYANQKIKAENCKGAALFDWGTEVVSNDTVPEAIGTIAELLGQVQTSEITFVSLGSLALYSACTESIPNFNTKVNQLIWVAGTTPDSTNFNYQLAPEAFIRVVKSNQASFIWIDAQEGFLEYSSSLQDSLRAVESVYAREILRSINQSGPFAKRLFDEQSILYLLDTTSFSITTELRNCKKVYYETKHVSPAFLQTILAEGLADRTLVISHFPSQAEYYQDDVAKIFDRAYHKYGAVEWNAGVLANELHRHLGLYAIIGVKMGIRAREYFGAGIDEMRIVSEAGLVPPYSCLNDGLQVSTGATLGHGLISVDEQNQRLPAARFTYLGKTVRVSLKPAYQKKASELLSGLRAVHGLSSDIYWELVREEALLYWLKWDRNEIFEIETY